MNFWVGLSLLWSSRNLSDHLGLEHCILISSISFLSCSSAEYKGSITRPVPRQLFQKLLCKEEFLVVKTVAGSNLKRKKNSFVYKPFVYLSSMHVNVIIFTQIVINFQMRGPLRQQSIMSSLLFLSLVIEKNSGYSQNFKFFTIWNFEQYVQTHRVCFASGRTTQPRKINGKYTKKNQRSLIPDLGPQQCKHILEWSLIWILKWIVSWCDNPGFCFRNLLTLCLLSVPTLWHLVIV